MTPIGRALRTATRQVGRGKLFDAHDAENAGNHQKEPNEENVAVLFHLAHGSRRRGSRAIQHG